METTRTQLEVNIENIDKALKVIKEFASEKDFDISGDLTTTTLNEFPSSNAKKRFKKALNRVIEHPTMKRASLFLHYLCKVSNCTAKLDYSAKEKAIRSKRKAWKDAQKVADNLMAEYKQEKGDYYIAL